MMPGLSWLRLQLVRRIISQVLVAGLLLWAVLSLIENTLHNLQARNIKVSLDFLYEVAPFNLSFSPFWDFELGKSTYWEVFVIGVQNTMLVSVLSIFTASLGGLLIGIMRISSNWFVAFFALIYIETFRNIPLLLQVMFWYFVVFLTAFPSPRESYELGAGIYLNNSGFFAPLPVLNPAADLGLFFFISGIACLLALGIYRHTRRLEKRDYISRLPKKILIIAGLIATCAVAYFLTGDPLLLEYPVLETFTFAGGFSVPLSLFALWFSLTVYTAAFIGENVRGGIQSVKSGQTEAALSLGLSKLTYLRLIIIPQALRVIIPPTISQYLNIIKNSSLAVAIAYEELVNLWSGIALNQSGQALIIMAMTVAVYETLSLLTSAFLNWYNKRVRLVER